MSSPQAVISAKKSPSSIKTKEDQKPISNKPESQQKKKTKKKEEVASPLPEQQQLEVNSPNQNMKHDEDIPAP